ncbi:MAG: SBBP repeat-containing protein [Chitinophagales bacterium]
MKNLTLSLLLFLSIFVSPALAQQKVSDYSVSPQFGFIENKGQIMDQDYKPNPDVKYLFPGKGVKVHLKQQSFSYEVVKYEEKERRFSEATGWVDELGRRLEEGEGLGREEPKEYDVHTQRIDIELVGSNPNAELVPANPAPDYINYYNSITPEEGATHVRHFDKVLYKDIYPNIDLEFSVAATDELKKGEFVKYNFIVHPGGDYRDIQLRYKGADGIKLSNLTSLQTPTAGATSEGSGCCNLLGHPLPHTQPGNCLDTPANKKGMDALTLTTAHGDLQESIPYSYQLSNGNEQEIKVNYIQLDDNLFGFKPNSKTANNSTFVIDPVLFWGTYYGGSESDYGNTVATDATENIYLLGTTYSSSGIASSGYQNTHGGDGDAFLVKFNTNGVRQWATYYGGSGNDNSSIVNTDPTGNVYISGHTPSTSGIASGGHQDTLRGSRDGFLVKFNNNGIRQWATYYGGSGDDLGISVTTDAASNVYLAGKTSSNSGIASGGHQNSFGGGDSDVYLVKFNTDGVRQWATYYGGSSNDNGGIVTTDPFGNVYLAGYGRSTSNISSGGHQDSLGGSNDAYLVKFNSNGVRLWATYYGGSSSEFEPSVATDAGGNVYLAGYTESTTGIASGGHQNSYGGGTSDAFLVKFNTNGVRQWGTYYGGSNLDVGRSVTISSNNNVYLTGMTSSTSDIASGGQQNLFGGGTYDAFLVRFNSRGIRQWATYYGGSGNDYGRSVTTNTNVYLTGYTNSTSGIASGGHQDTKGGSNDAFLAKFWGEGIRTPYLVKGNIYADINGNCIQDTSDILRPHIIVKAEPGPYFGMSDTNGNYVIYVADTGNYTISLATQDNIWQTSCNTSYNAQLNSTPDTATGIDFAMTAAYYCARLGVDVSTIRLRRCFDNTFYFEYNNTGTLPASGAYIEVDFGQHLQPQNSSLAWSSFSGNVYTFTIGNLDVNEQGTFEVTALLSCNAQLNSTQCVSARILPDEPCGIPDSAYDRRQLHIKGQCIAGDSVEYTINNYHDSITQSGYYELYLNSTLLDSIPFTIAPQDSSFLTFPANGNTIRLEAVFDYGTYTVPGPQSTVEACGPTPAWGHVNTLPQNDDALNFETFCLTVIGAYDPNDKQVFPEGLTSNQYIQDDTELEYLIRFQNTGTDTAFTVIIRDTFSSFLDIPSIQLGSSSHDYTFNIYGQGIAEWTFNNILLPDSHVNEPASHGYVKYKISQKPNNTAGTLIENRAGIYFDFNLPVITNTVFNTVYDSVLICNKPNVDFSYSLNILELSLNNLTLNGQNYTWDMDDSTYYSIASPVHLYDSIGSYNVCLTASNTCGTNTKCDTVTITHALFTQPINNTKFCAGDSLTIPYLAQGTFLQGNDFIAQLSDDTGSFSNPVDIGSLNDIVSGSITAILPANIPGGSGYRVRVISTNPAINAKDNGTDLKINPKPSAPLVTPSGATEFCDGDSVILTSSEANGNLWSNGETSQSITVNASENYSVMFTDTNGCVSPSSDTVDVTVNPIPTAPVITPNGTIELCDGDSIMLTSSETDGNLWSNGDASQSITVNTSGNYSVMFTDNNGCVSLSSDTVDVTVNPNPVAPVITPSGATEFCDGDSVVLSSSEANGNLWSNGETSQSITVNISGNYSVMFTDTNGCVSPSSDTVDLTVHQILTAPVITLSGATEFCDGDSVVLSSSEAIGNLWSNGDTSQSITINTSGNYSVMFTDTNGCQSPLSDTVSVIVHPIPFAPVITPGGSIELCDGDSVILSSSEANGNLWGDSSTTNEIIVDETGVYSVKYTDANGCESAFSSAVDVTVLSLPQLTFSLPADTIVCESSSSIELSGGMPSGGVYTGANVSNGQFDPQEAGTGIHGIAYTVSTI